MLQRWYFLRVGFVLAISATMTAIASRASGWESELPPSSQSAGTTQHVIARVEYRFDGGEPRIECKKGSLTVPAGYTASRLKYHWIDPQAGDLSDRLTAVTIYSLTENRYIKEAKTDANCALPEGDYEVVCGGSPGSLAVLTYTLFPADATGRSSDAALKRLWDSIVDFRHGCAAQGSRGWQQYATPLVRQRLREVDELLWPNEADTGWSYFFSLAYFDIARPTSESPLVGFYHPWSDVWLFTQWEVMPEVKIVGFDLVSGEYVRQRGTLPLDPRVDWLRRDGFRVEQLARSIVDNLRDFQQLAYENASWRDALQLSDPSLDSTEFNMWLVSLRLTESWLRAEELALGRQLFGDAEPMPTALEPLVQSCRQFLDAGQAGQVAELVDRATGTHPRTAETLRQLPPDVFGRFNPVYWLADEQSAQAFLILDRNPDLCLALTYTLATRELQLDRVDLLHFPTAAKVMLNNGTP